MKSDCKISLAGTDSESGKFTLDGKLDFTSVNVLNESALNQFANHRRITIDLTNISYVNSAGLALLLDWKRWAALNERSLEIFNIPEKLLNIARICEVDTILLGQE